MSGTCSLDLKELSAANLTQASRATLLTKIKQHAQTIKSQWRPGLIAKKNWDDEYNFPAGRYAGQGVELNKRLH
ncbi:hypothetical protein BDV12DRAFT_204961 [Aspergillus spectabilis]